MEQAPRRAIAFVFAEHAATTVTAAATVVALGGGLLAVGLVESSKSTTPASPLDNHWILTGLILGILGVAVAIANVVVLVLRRMAAERWRTHLAILTNQGQNMLTRSIAGQSVPLKDIADWYAIVRDDLVGHDPTGALPMRFEAGQQLSIPNDVEFLNARIARLAEFLREIRD